MHFPVLLQEAVDCLVTHVDGLYVDATFGRGGHTREILRRLDSSGRVLAIDRDPQAYAAGIKEFANEPRLMLEQAKFSQLGRLVGQYGWSGRVNGILLDLGVSSPQLDDPARGFSFSDDGPLDMRMDPAEGVSASEWINQAAEEEIARVLKEFGEERYARRIAHAVVSSRKERTIRTTHQLSEIVARANPSWERDRHPATRTFQAIRILVNREMEELDAVLQKCPDLLAVGGRLVVISFHSLEDRRVKRFIRAQTKVAPQSRRMPPVPAGTIRMRRLGRFVRASASEIEQNVRSRSAIMRAVEKTQ